MKRTATFFIIFLFIAACQKSAVDPTPGGSTPSFTAKHLGSVNSAAPFDGQENIDIASLGLQASTCTGEPLQIISGIYHIDTHGIVNQNKLSVTEHQNAMNFKLVGLSAALFIPVPARSTNLSTYRLPTANMR